MLEGGRRGFLDVLSEAARRDLLDKSRTIKVRKGQTVLAHGEPPGDVFIIQSGLLQVVLYAADGREVSLRQLSAGQLFGELAAIGGETRSAGVVAASDAQLLAIGAEVFRTVVREHADAANWLILRLTTQVRGLTDRLFEMSALNVRARLHCELIRLARLNTGAGGPAAPTHAELASRIGTHREAVTRELSVLAKQKIIRSGRRRLEFLDIAGLENVVAASMRAPVGTEGWW